MRAPPSGQFFQTLLETMYMCIKFALLALHYSTGLFTFFTCREIGDKCSAAWPWRRGKIKLTFLVYLQSISRNNSSKSNSPSISITPLPGGRGGSQQAHQQALRPGQPGNQGGKGNLVICEISRQLPNCVVTPTAASSNANFDLKIQKSIKDFFQAQDPAKQQQ